MHSPGFGAGVYGRLAILKVVGQLVAFGDVLAVTERHMTDEPYFAFGLVIAAAVASSDLGFGNDSDWPGRIQMFDARVRCRSGLAIRTVEGRILEWERDPERRSSPSRSFLCRPE